MSYSDRHESQSVSINLTTVADVVLLVPLQRIVVHKVGIAVLTAGSDGVQTVTFQKTSGAIEGTDTTIKAVIVTDASHTVGTIVYGVPTAPVVVEPGDRVQLSVPEETSGTGGASAVALVEYSFLDLANADDANLVATA